MKISFQGITYTCDDALSFKVFTNWDFISRPSYDFAGKVIYGTSFYQERLDADIFGKALPGTIFVNCNLDNVRIPLGATVIGCSQKAILVQNDLRDWELDAQSKPVKACNEEYWIAQSISVDPAHIPEEKIVISKDQTLVEKLLELKAATIMEAVAELAVAEGKI